MSVSAFPYGTTAAAGAGETPTVSPRADGDANVNSDNFPVTCYVGCDFDIDGDEWEVNANTNAQENSTVWLDSGSASDVWVEFVRTSGTATNWDSHTSSVRYRLDANRRFRASVTRSTPGINNFNITGYFRMWDAASGGSTLWTGSTVEWRATANYQDLDKCSTC